MTAPLVNVHVSPTLSTISVAAVGTIVPLAEAVVVEALPAGVLPALDEPLLVDDAVLDEPTLAGALEELSPVEDEQLHDDAVVAGGVVVVGGAVAVVVLVAPVEVLAVPEGVELLGEQLGTATAGAPFWDQTTVAAVVPAVVFVLYHAQVEVC